MGVPSTTNYDVGTAVASVSALAASLKVQCANNITALQGGPVSADQIIGVLSSMSGQGDRIASLKATVGLNAQAQTQIPGYVGTMTSDITVLQTALQGVIDWVVNNIPKDANGFILIYTMTPTGSKIVRTFSPAQTTGLVTQLQALQATIS